MGGGHGIEGSRLVSKRAARAKFRESILSSWNHRCAYCGREGAETLDHVRARSRGGEALEANLVAACCQCNRDKGSDNWLEWFSRQDFYCGLRAERIEAWVSRVEAA
jgi:hypothetical protein